MSKMYKLGKSAGKKLFAKLAKEYSPSGGLFDDVASNPSLDHSIPGHMDDAAPAIEKLKAMLGRGSKVVGDAADVMRHGSGIVKGVGVGAAATLPIIAQIQDRMAKKQVEHALRRGAMYGAGGLGAAALLAKMVTGGGGSGGSDAPEEEGF